MMSKKEKKLKCLVEENIRKGQLPIYFDYIKKIKKVDSLFYRLGNVSKYYNTTHHVAERYHKKMIMI